MANDPGDTREQGIEFGGLTAGLEEESYPLSHEALLNRYGDRELGLGDDQVALREVLSPEMEQEYEDVESVRQAVFTMVSDDAIGREGYSDRGGSGSDGTDPNESESV